MNCCDNTYDLGCINHCEEIKLPFDWLENPETLKVQSSFVGNVSEWDFSVNRNNPILIPNEFNESATSSFKILRQDGSLVAFELEGVTYDCFKVKVSPLINKTNYYANRMSDRYGVC